MHERALLDEIYAAPDDDGPRSILADHLIERGDPRGTFIALQLARARDKDPLASHEEHVILSAHWRAWVATTTCSPQFERGLWASAQATEDLPDEVLGDPRWGTVCRLEVGPALEPKLTALLAATARSLRTIVVPSRGALAQVAQSGLRIEEVVLRFDVSRAPPSLAPITALPALRRLGFHCEAELAVRWLERANEIGVREVFLDLRPHVDYLRKVMRRAKRTQLARLAISIHGETVIHAERDSDGSLAIRSIHIAPASSLTTSLQLLDGAKTWISALHAHVDPGVKITSPHITAALAEQAEARGLRLVRRATSFAIAPRLIA